MSDPAPPPPAPPAGRLGAAAVPAVARAATPGSTATSGDPEGTEPAPTAADRRVDRCRVLLIEDDAGDAFLVEEYLAEAVDHYDVVWVRSIDEARGAPGRFDCVVLDLGLPDAVGLAALQAVRATQRAPIVVLTGLNDESVGLDAVATGAEDFLTKGGINSSSLSRAIRFAVARRRAEEADRRLAEAAVRDEDNQRLARGLFARPMVSDPRISWNVRYRPGGEGALLGGDFFDAVELPDGWLHLIIGDVAGHGPDEAAIGVSLRNGWRTLVLAGHLPAEIPSQLDKLLKSEVEAMTFATACQVSIPPDRRSARVLLAGHPPPILLGPDPEELAGSVRGIPLGIHLKAPWRAEEIPLPPEWSLLFYTDGLVEGRAPTESGRWGVEGLTAAIQELPDSDPDALLDGLIAEAEALHGAELDDDVAALLLRCAGDGAAVDGGRGSGDLGGPGA